MNYQLVNSGLRIALMLIMGTGVALAMTESDDVPVDTIETESLWTIPGGLPEDVPAPEDNPFDRATVLLGRRLFFDPILSIDRNRACASCHQPQHGFSSPEARPAALTGGVIERNVPTLYNRAFGNRQMWDGRFSSLEAQALMPIAHEQEMGLPIDEALERLRENEEYATKFRGAFGKPPDQETLARALASFVRRLFYGDTPMDRFRAGKVFALTSDERAGMWIFQSKAGCWRCHNGFNFTDEKFHNTGVGAAGGNPEAGRMTHTGDPADAGAFKTPTLRALLETPPYFHDGSVATLREVVEFYNRGGEANSNLDVNISELNLTEHEINLLVAFLGSLTKREGE